MNPTPIEREWLKAASEMLRDDNVARITVAGIKFERKEVAKALETYSRAGAEPMTVEAVHGSQDIGRTGGSSPSTGAMLAICDGEGIKRMAPQGPYFHWRDGWCFCRGEANAVHIYNDKIELKIPAAEWDSITRHLNGNLP